MLILPLVLLLVTTLLSILAIVLYSIIQVNEDARISSEDYVSAIIEDKLNQQATLAKDYAFWDETIQHAYLTQNTKWLEQNLGAYLTATFKVTDLFIINEHDKLVLSLKDGQLNNSNYKTVNKAALTSLISKARLSAPLPVPVSGIMKINNFPAIVGVSILAPENGPALPVPQPVLVVIKRVETEQILEISKQYRLNKLQFSAKQPAKNHKAFLKILNPTNSELGYLSWQPVQPGNLMLSKIKLPLIILLIGIGIITFVIINASLITTKRLKDAYNNMAHLANHDVLTGLSNRRLFEELLEQTIHAAKRDNISSAMLYLDLDGFKKINDTYGHHEGDKLLVTVAERLKESIREADTIARIGGDEFTILLRNTSSQSDIKATVQKIQVYLEQPIQLSHNEVSISASIGITMIPQDGTDPDMLMTKADLALYECKKHGRNTFRFYSSLNE
ncbi:MAG: diguanylate cyclase [Gammaproteobacteria bacterium]|nr:diguanylate cyclase [Gammaproteobacteria bacterium]MCW8988805.1 diguanylate cyclase [Gammaproteobacteria bacterium]MCW9032287.1 diguanylate cyclase [Gammaproteobacteria bacterium]